MQVADKEVQNRDLSGDLETLFEKASHVNKGKQGLVEVFKLKL